MLSKRRREKLAEQLLASDASWGLGWVSSGEIDSVGLSASLTLGTKRALEQITVPYHEIIIDGTVNFLAETGKGRFVTTMKKADLLIGAVSAASIIAKVARDDYMADLDTRYEGYDFGSHAGYGTAKHRAAIDALGVISEHRRSFAPIAAIVSNGSTNSLSPSNPAAPTAKSIGNEAENIVADWLKSEGYDVLERNWKTKFCEIDIIAKHAGYLVFVEVKHRKTADHGDGVAAITSTKLRQMRFAASLYLLRHPDSDARLAVVTTAGSDTVEIEDLLFVD
jgi:ribonuclease HII